MGSPENGAVLFTRRVYVRRFLVQVAQNIGFRKFARISSPSPSPFSVLSLPTIERRPENYGPPEKTMDDAAERKRSDRCLARANDWNGRGSIESIRSPRSISFRKPVAIAPLSFVTPSLPARDIFPLPTFETRERYISRFREAGNCCNSRCSPFFCRIW